MDGNSGSPFSSDVDTRADGTARPDIRGTASQITEEFGPSPPFEIVQVVFGIANENAAAINSAHTPEAGEQAKQLAEALK